MNTHNIPNAAFLQVGFKNPDTRAKLETIELYGVPGEKNSLGEFKVNDNILKFFDARIIQELFCQSRKQLGCDFSNLKVWIYDTTIRNAERGYAVPDIDERDWTIKSQLKTSRLKRIYFLDNGLTDEAGQQWRQKATNLLTPLFSSFQALPSGPDTFLTGFFKSIMEKIDPYEAMVRDVFFNALIVQID